MNTAVEKYNQPEFIATYPRRYPKHGYTLERQIKELDRYTVAIVDFVIDDSPDLSDLGEYTSHMAEWTVDRREGILYGTETSITYTYKTRSESRALARAAKRAKRDRFQLDEDSQHEADLDVYQNGEYFEITYSGYLIASEDLYTDHDRNSHDYIRASMMQIDGDSPANQVEIGYLVENCNRMEKINRGEIAPVFIDLTVFYMGGEIGSDSLSGLEHETPHDLDGTVQEMIDGLNVPALVKAKRHELLQIARSFK